MTREGLGNRGRGSPVPREQRHCGCAVGDPDSHVDGATPPTSATTATTAPTNNCTARFNADAAEFSGANRNR